MVQVSEDIFYQVKKEILDKLDIILQKINLEIISYLHPQEEEFSFIELSSFEYEITHLFHYLDRLYTSLNSSVSFSSINSRCSLDCHSENQRLLAQNHQLHTILLQLQSQHSDQDHHRLPLQEQPSLPHGSPSGTFDRQGASRSSQQVNMDELRDNVRALMSEFKAVGKDVKRMLKKYKFQMLQSRVEIISRLKEEQSRGRASKDEGGSQELELHLQADGQGILQKINQILSIC